jgi:cellulose synthase/poly-beta-1,6-N-acetylglucosamine synthase-like glycosyltransferase
MVFASIPLYLIPLILAFPYILVITLITMGWLKIKSFRSNEPVAPTTTVSIIIPARNESEVMERCIKGILMQDFPKQLMEVIIIDDHSEDQTHKIATRLSEASSDVKITVLSLDKLSGKKEAIRLAMKFATGTFILCTDADCMHPVEWVNTMVRFYEVHKPVFISGPVLLESTGGVFGKFQEYEFMSLVASGAGAIGAHMPIMCNGANLGFSQTAYDKLNPDALKTGISSGDDVFLMLAFRERYGSERVSFVKSRNAIVLAGANRTLAGFIRQRLRWVSKSRAYRDPFLIISALTVMLMNVMIAVAFFSGIFNTCYLFYGCGLLLLKTLTDFPLLISFSRFAGMKNTGWYIPVMEPFVVLMTTFTALAGNVASSSWKGRKIK